MGKVNAMLLTQQEEEGELLALLRDAKIYNGVVMCEGDYAAVVERLEQKGLAKQHTSVFGTLLWIITEKGEQVLSGDLDYNQVTGGVE